MEVSTKTAYIRNDYSSRCSLAQMYMQFARICIHILDRRERLAGTRMYIYSGIKEGEGSASGPMGDGGV
jgi:hypothetical protein